MDKIYEKSETGCCKRFDPTPWEDKEVVFKEKLFLKDSVRSFFHIPLNFGQVVVRNVEKMKKAEALPEEQLMLCDEKSMWGTDVYIEVSKEVPGSEMVKMSGTFLTKVFEGSFQNMGRWIKEMKEFVSKKGKEIKKMYFCYTTCPACAKYYGKNYVVILGEVE